MMAVYGCWKGHSWKVDGFPDHESVPMSHECQKCHEEGTLFSTMGHDIVKDPDKTADLIPFPKKPGVSQ